jgi:hypothetical protein
MPLLPAVLCGRHAVADGTAFPPEQSYSAKSDGVQLPEPDFFAFRKNYAD